MSLAEFLSKDLLKSHSTGKAEITQLLAVVRREIKDASVTGLSTDRRFACSYNAALQLSHIVIASTGYRTNPSKSGHHKLTFEAAELILGAEVQLMLDHFEIARRKRNMIDYNVSGSISESESEDLQKAVLDFQTHVLKWLSANHPDLI